ncbi:MAG: hypothetical protein O6952_08465 [Planctomycetota bacterium]|nr:hypothetical protein [Planctomycetota bacterium]
MEVRINGEIATIGAKGPLGPAQITKAITHWADKSGSTLCSLALDGKATTAQALLDGEESGGDPPKLLEIGTLRPSDVGTYAIRRAAGLLPGLRLDLSMAKRSLGQGESREGLQALFKTVSTLGSIEAAVRSLSRIAPDLSDDWAPVSRRLQALLDGIRSSIEARDLDRLAALLREGGKSLVEDLGNVFQAVLES